MSFMDLFDKDEKALAQKALDYYDGESVEYLLEYMRAYRKNAMMKGCVPRTRNLVKTIVDKSGLLFNDHAPTIQVYVGEQVDEEASTTTQQIFESAGWIEFFTNFDSVLRMLKTAYVLVQVNPEDGQWMFEILDQHNCAVHVTEFKKLDTLIYQTGKTKDGATYRIWTNDLVQELFVDVAGQERITSVMDNPFGIIPAAVFHDTNIPRTSVWNKIPSDLMTINSIYDLALTDSDFSGQWNKQPTLFTNAMIQGGDNSRMVEKYIPGQPFTAWVPSTEPGFVGGPGSVVGLETTGGESVFIDYKAPDANLMPLDEMVNKWVHDFASDWSVRIGMDGNGAADSGFKLIVQEMPNLDLRKQRQRMFEAGFKRLYQIIKVIAPLVGISLPEDSELFIKFAPPSLPVDEKVKEDVWAARIAGSRASRVDYFMEVHGMSREEAIAKVQEVQAFNAAQTPARTSSAITQVQL